MAAALAACGDDSESPQSEGAAGGSSDTKEGSIKIAFPSVPGYSNVGVLAAADDLKEQGYDVEVVHLAQSELATQGVISGDFDIAAGAGIDGMVAIEKGSPLKIISERARNEYAMVSAEGIEDCDDMDGSRYGIHSHGGISTAMANAWLDQECPDITPRELVIPGSDARAQAMQAGQLDLTVMELGDLIQLQRTDRIEVNVLDTLAGVFPELKVALVYANSDYIAEHPDIVGDLVAAQVRAHQRIADEPGYLAGLFEEYLDGVDPELAEAAADAYIEAEIFDPTGGRLDDESMTATVDFLLEEEALTKELTPDQLMDTSFLEAAQSAS
jgi:NitT/TauT family transport system substrate-binding protein